MAGNCSHNIGARNENKLTITFSTSPFFSTECYQRLEWSFEDFFLKFEVFSENFKFQNKKKTSKLGNFNCW